MDAAATLLQKHVRGFLARRHCTATKHCVLVLQAAVRGYLVRMEFKRMRELRAAVTVQVRRAWTAVFFVLSAVELTLLSLIPAAVLAWLHGPGML